MNTSGSFMPQLKADIARLRRQYESQRIAQVKKIHENIKKIAKEEKDVWFPAKTKDDEVVE
jgi:predicted transposase YbfD/YdcC